MYKGLHAKYALFLSDFNDTSIFREIFGKKKSQILNFIKVLPMLATLFHADGQTDMTKLIVASRNFANAPKHLSGYSWRKPVWPMKNSSVAGGRTFSMHMRFQRACMLLCFFFPPSIQFSCTVQNLSLSCATASVSVS